MDGYLVAPASPPRVFHHGHAATSNNDEHGNRSWSCRSGSRSNQIIMGCVREGVYEREVIAYVDRA